MVIPFFIDTSATEKCALAPTTNLTALIKNGAPEDAPFASNNLLMSKDLRWRACQSEVIYRTKGNTLRRTHSLNGLAATNANAYMTTAPYDIASHCL